MKNYLLVSGYRVGAAVVCRVREISPVYYTTRKAHYRLAFASGEIYDDHCPANEWELYGGAGRPTDDPNDWAAVPASFYNPLPTHNEYGEVAP